MQRPIPAEQVVELALEVGFDLAGVAPLSPPRGARRFRDWLAGGYHAGMKWLERDMERILDPQGTLPEGKSLLILGLGHARAPVSTPEGARIARYAAGRDYHNVVRRMQRKLADRLRERGILGRWRAIVDAGPLLERSHAAEAGLGFESRAANLLHPRWGPWFFLGELLLEAEVTPTPIPPAGSCGTCTACLDACPTQAIREPGVVDSNLCLSYHTIENRGPIPHELRAKLGDWVFGCDVCSEVCPWGEKAPDVGTRYGTHAAIEGRGLADWLHTPAEAWGEAFRGSALQRARRDGLLRNAALVLGTVETDGGEHALREALEDEASAMVREAAFWALAHGHAEQRGVAELLGRALLREEDPAARAGMEKSLAEH